MDLELVGRGIQQPAEHPQVNRIYWHFSAASAAGGNQLRGHGGLPLALPTTTGSFQFPSLLHQRSGLGPQLFRLL